MKYLLQGAVAVLCSATLLFAQDDFAGKASATKAASPSADEQSATIKTVKEVFSAEWAAARSPTQKQALAKKLLDKGRESGADKTAQFVLLQSATDFAAQAGEVGLAFDAINEMNKLFNIDLFDIQVTTLTKASAASVPADRHAAISQRASEVAELAVVKGNYSVATTVADLAVSEARKGGKPDLTKQAASRKGEIREFAKLFEEAKSAIDVIDKQPSDPAANLAIGKYSCLVENDWNSGLKHLAKCDDPILKPLAEADIKQPTTAAEQAKLADAWWEVGGVSKKRALYWYKQALPGLTGISRDKATKRIEELGETDPWEPFDISQAKPMDGFLQIPRTENWKADSKVNTIKTKNSLSGGFTLTMVVRTEKNNIRIQGPGKAHIILNWENNPKLVKLSRPDGSLINIPSQPLTANEWHTLVWVVTTEGMSFSIDGDSKFSESKKNELPNNFTIVASACDSNIDVKTLTIKPER